MLKVLVVENSASARALLVEILRSDPEITDVRTAASGEDALRVLEIWRPDVVTMDINMTGMDGFETTSRIMQTRPVPIVVVSGHWNPEETKTVFKTMEAGALAALGKPPSPTHPDFDRRSRELVRSIKLLSRVKPIRKRVAARAVELPSAASSHGLQVLRPRILAIGGSTGAPPVLKTLLSGLPTDFPGAILVVQHMSPGFLGGMARWLRDTTGFRADIPQGGEVLKSGHLYLAPDARHMGVGRDGRIFLSDDALEHSMRPAVSFLFRTLARNQPGRAVGVLLTGMGADGALELKQMRDAACTTIAQNEATSVVFGMPGKAVEIGAARYVLPPDQIVHKIKHRFGVGDRAAQM